MGRPLVTHRLQLGFLILNLLDDLRLLSLLALEIGFQRFHGGSFLLQLGDLATVFANDPEADGGRLLEDAVRRLSGESWMKLQRAIGSAERSF